MKQCISSERLKFTARGRKWSPGLSEGLLFVQSCSSTASMHGGRRSSRAWTRKVLPTCSTLKEPQQIWHHARPPEELPFPHAGSESLQDHPHRSLTVPHYFSIIKLPVHFCCLFLHANTLLEGGRGLMWRGQSEPLG